MNKLTKRSLAGLVLVAALAYPLYWGTGWLFGTAPEEIVIEVPPHTTVFVVPLTEDSSQQRQLTLEELKEMRVDARLITIPRKKVYTGWMAWSYRWQPMVELRLNDRTPVVREWTSDAHGTQVAGDGLPIRTSDSIRMSAGVTLSARILETEAYKYQYHFGQTPLEMVLDKNIRQAAGVKLNTFVSKYDLTTARMKKPEAFDRLMVELTADAKELGIQIDYVALDGGYTYVNPAVQASIDRQQIENLRAQVEGNRKRAQDERNKITEADALTAKALSELLLANKGAVEFDNQIRLIEKQAQAVRQLAQSFKRGGGKLPAVVLPSGQAGGGAPLMLNLDGK